MLASIAEQLRFLIGDNIFWNISFLGNTMIDYFIFLLFFGALFLVLRIFRKIALKRVKDYIKKVGKTTGETIVLAIDTIKPPFYWYVAFFLSVNLLNLDPLIEKSIKIIMIVWVAYQVVKILQVFIDYGLQVFIQKREDLESQTTISGIGKFVKAILWFFAALFVLSNLGINVTSVMAGLGIGGIAIAFALKSILGDLFSSFAIFFDKPFRVGDFIVVGEHLGVVESIGIKSTRLRALQGEEIVISNAELTSAKIQNFKKLRKRRVAFRFGVTYDTSVEKMKKIPKAVEEIIMKVKLAEPDRINFCEFADSSLNFEAVYFCNSSDFNEYMDTHEQILLGIKEYFEKEGISMAFPTRTIILEKSVNL